jgi:ADP-ribose pyrophosphatase YjhB (NUDIX family)
VERPASWPRPTVDVIIETAGGIVLIERGHPPPGWALPGGHVDTGEFVADAARREAREETGLDVELLELFGVYSDPGRDPRYHTISTVFIGRAHGTPVGGDDAARAAVFDRKHLPGPIAFDHGAILEDYFRYRQSGQRPPLRR